MVSVYSRTTSNSPGKETQMGQRPSVDGPEVDGPRPNIKAKRLTQQQGVSPLPSDNAASEEQRPVSGLVLAGDEETKREPYPGWQFVSLPPASSLFHQIFEERVAKAPTSVSSISKPWTKGRPISLTSLSCV